MQYWAIFSPEWVKTWVGSLTHFLRPTFPRQKRKKRPEISRFQVFYGCGGRTRTCGLRVMSCSEAPIPCNARVSRIFLPRKSRKTRRPDEFAPRPSSGLSRKWVGFWVRADWGVSRNGTLNQRRGFFSSAWFSDPSSYLRKVSYYTFYWTSSQAILLSTAIIAKQADSRQGYFTAATLSCE